MAGKSKKKPEDNFYRDLGRTIRLARMAAGKTQMDVADEIGVSFPQLQKYENGNNRIPVERLLAMADYLKVPVLRLLSLPERDADLLSMTERFQANGFHTLLESWADIKDQSMRTAILNVVKRAAALSR
jgi:transcriptional regulator with XRE-family HTH domain